MPATVAQLGARALRKIGVAITANVDRPGAGPTSTSAQIAARVLLEMGIPVAESERPGVLPAVGYADIAARAMRAVGVDPAPVGSGSSTGAIYTAAQLAQSALVKLAVIAADEAPSTPDQVEAQARVFGVHDMLVGLDMVSWSLSAVPGAVAEAYIIMAAQLLAPQFGKPANMEAFAAAQNMVRVQALAGAQGQALAEAKVQAVQDSLNAAGLVTWPVSAIPAAFAEDYTTMTATLLAPTMQPGRAAVDRQADMAAWDAAEGRIRRAAHVRGAQARALTRVAAVHEELNGMGLVTWSDDTIPASMADAYTTMATAMMGSEDGKPMDAATYTANMARVRQLAMGGPVGQALAEQKVRAVHASLEARGKTRWTLYDIPAYAEEPYVFMAATFLAPECDRKADPAWWPGAEADLARIVSLPSARGPVMAAYF